jgi:hypothetical protein
MWTNLGQRNKPQPHSQRAVQNAVAQSANVKPNSVAKGIARLIVTGEVASHQVGFIQLP